MRLDVTLGGRSRSVDVVRTDGGWRVCLDDGPPIEVRGRALDAVTWQLALGQAEARRLEVALDGERAFVLDGVQPLQGTVVDPRAHLLDLAAGAGQGEVRTQMPGAVVRILVEAGAEVAEGAVLLVVEAMKMENEFKAPFAARVVALHVEAGAAVEAGALLVQLEPLEA
ncbi:MAG: hypothetical protein H6732_15745 [Alphaproteobacteria bacterium]|nr:hypothetical protein [Alphaproteobacteria bacterium]